MNFKLKFLILAAVGIPFLSCNQSKPNPEIRLQPSVTKEGVNPYVAIDKSPMDMSYFPKDFPILRMNGAGETDLIARVIYSRPQRKGRSIFGNGEKNLVQYGKEWRMGANEATEIEFFKNVKISGQPLPKGRYILYCIPTEKSWTIVFNANLYTWGLHMDPKKDVLRVTEPVTEQLPPVEELTIFFEPSASGASLYIVWDTVKVKVPINF